VDFSLSSEQTLIKQSVDSFVADEYGFEARKHLVESEEGFSRKHWATMAELGWLGIAFPEDRGGFGGTPIETMLLMEAFGKGLVLEPFVPCVVLAGSALAYGGTSDAHRSLLESMIAGESILTLAYAEPAGRYDPAYVATRARIEGNDLIITGSKRAVPYGASADAFVVSVRASGGVSDRDGISLVVVESNADGLRRHDYRLIDGTRASDLTFDNVRVPLEGILGGMQGIDLLEKILDAGLAAQAAEAVGIMATMLPMTVDYLKQRVQFGVPIGSFQALQHRAVDMLIALEQARSIAYYGTMTLAKDNVGDIERKRALSATKVQIAKSGRTVGQSAIQLHGGIGMTEEYAVGHYFKRMTALELALGDADFHLERYVDLGRANDRADTSHDALTPPRAEGALA
jgi:alkylation response protein AidB-like acyl-CoA dehydrogenase